MYVSHCSVLFAWKDLWHCFLYLNVINNDVTVSQDQRILELMLAKREGEKKAQREKEAARKNWDNQKSRDLAARLSMDVQRRRSLSESRKTPKNSSQVSIEFSWWQDDIETLSALLVLCEGNLPVAGGFSLQFFFLLTRTRCWTNSPDADDLRCHDAHVMLL